ncbi:hypothetical protein L208DRAFT_1414301 [Tricholoma matsutake]|nr:hypothetical protein L208DRAFT_1414301 [Tricholoma matsutake 945]
MRPEPEPLNLGPWHLDKFSLVLTASTGSGKTAAFYAPLLVMEHLLQNPVAGIPQPPPHPIALTCNINL